MDQRKLDLSSSAFGTNRDGSGRQHLGLLLGAVSLLFCVSFSGCLSPNGTISFGPITNGPFTGPGALLTSFGNQGTISTSEMFVNYGSKGMAIDSTGRMVVAGFVLNPSNPNTSNFAVGRFNTDGSIDTTFGTNGLTTFQYESGNVEKACAVIIDPANNSIVVGGTSIPTGSGVRTAVFQQLDPNGNIETGSTFNPNLINTPNNTAQIVFYNMVDVTNSNNDDSCVSLITAPPSGISNVSSGYFAAYSLPSTSEAGAMQMFAVYLSEANNAAPTQFVAPVTAGTLDYAYDIRFAPSCTYTSLLTGICPIVVLGSDSTTNGSGDLLIWNFDYHEGTVTNNNVTALKVSDLSGSVDIPRTSMFDFSGNLLITGYTSLAPEVSNGGHVFFLIRANSSTGYALDTTYGNQGYAYNPFTTLNSEGFAMTEDNQGHILVGGGFTGQGTGLDQVVLRYEPSGFLDPSFGPFNGLATTEVTPEDDVVTGIYFDSTRQRILTVGLSGATTDTTTGMIDGGTITFSAYAAE
jgi:uncharacterized delta-60 repeat protein